MKTILINEGHHVLAVFVTHSMGARNRVGTDTAPAYVDWLNRFLGLDPLPLKSLKIPSRPSALFFFHAVNHPPSYIVSFV